jgi:hypothetical protein
MARYKDLSFSRGKPIAIVLSQQITPSMFEYAVILLADKHLDMMIFHSRYNNDEVGCLAYHPFTL